MLLGGLHERFVFGRRIRTLAHHLEPLLPANAAVVDIGCGDGTLAAVLMRERVDVRITGVDVLVRPDAKIPVTLFDGARLPFQDGSFDVAMLVDVLHHTDNPIALLREARRVARLGVIIKDHALSGIGARATLAIMDWIGNAHHGVRLPYTYWTLAEWRRAFRDLELSMARLDQELGLYPQPFSWIFDRHLHFVSLLTKMSDRQAANKSH